MLNFLILAVFAYLTFRVINRAFLNLEALVYSLASKPSEDTNPQQAPASPIKSANKPQKSLSKVEKPAPSKPSEKKVPAPSKVQEAPKATKDVFGNTKVEIKSQVMTSFEGGTKRNSYLEFQKELKLEEKASHDKAELQELQRELQIYKAEHQQMLQQIEKYKQEKQNYVNKIEDIIQHVINSQPAPQIIPELENDIQMKALAELTKGIDQAQQSQVERFQKREIEFKSEMSNFEQRIKQQYDADLNTLNQQLQEKEKEIQLLRQTPQERVVVEGDNSSFEKEIAGYLQKLKEKDVEIEKLKISQQNRLSPVKSSPAKAPENSENNALIEENLQLKTEKQSLLAQLQVSNAELQVLRAKFRQQKDKSNIFENDKLQEEIKLKAQVESLEKLKLDLQSQVDQLNEALFKEQQDKTQKIAQAKEQLSRKHELEVQSLTKQLEKEQQDRKEAQKKVIETQSELQFVQEQLKTAVESEKTLNAQIQALKSPKKVEKSAISVSDVQSHTEYIRLKQKVDQLETTIKQNKASDKGIKTEESIEPERKVNYARTKIERQASPTFQYETKERTPVKVEPKIVSSIFTGPVERVQKMKSPISLRYNTPAERPVVQSSIFQGGLMSEVYFGETNILNPKQREFVISQINFLKKISAKRTKLLYRSQSANFEKAVIEYCGNVPNILIVVELSNTRVFAAFTQAAFNKQSTNSQEKKYTSANKAMIIDLNRMEVIINAASQDTIRYEQGSLIWGRNEFVVSNEGRLACQLNCNDAIYPCKYSSQEFMGTANKSATFTKYEIYRIFLG